MKRQAIDAKVNWPYGKNQYAKVIVDRKPLSVVNALSVDVEGFVESNIQSFPIAEKYTGQQRENNEIEQNVNVLLELLAEHNVCGTFFFVGRIGRDIPLLVRQVAKAGHEIGCHSYKHLRIFGIAAEQFKKKLEDAKKTLEDAAGQKVYGFRAPDFSITNKSLWVLDILKELGFVYDSSIYPIGLHDVYGIEGAKPAIHKLPNGLIEFPLSTVKLFSKCFPFGGGGYFRLYPIWLTKYLFKRLNSKGLSGIFYIHPYEVGHEIPQIAEISAYRKFRHYYNCGKTERLTSIIKSVTFIPIIQLLRENNYAEPAEP